MANLAKSLKNVRDYVRIKLQDPSKTYWADSDIDLEINNVKDELYNAICTINEDFFLKPATVTIPAGATDVKLPEDFFRLKNIRTTSPADAKYQDWRPLDLATRSFNTGISYPENGPTISTMYYDIYTTADTSGATSINADINRMRISPIMGVELTVSIDYIYQVPDLTADTDTFSVFNVYSNYIQQKTIAECFRTGPSGPYDVYDKKAAALLDTILTNAGKRQNKSNEFVQDMFDSI